MDNNGVFNRARVVAPLGRMALTQSLPGTGFFFGHGLGQDGMGRAMQAVYVFTFISVQHAFSTCVFRTNATARWNGCGMRSLTGRFHQCSTGRRRWMTACLTPGSTATRGRVAHILESGATMQ